MTAADTPSVLQRMAAPPTPVAAEVPLTAARAVKLAMKRSAEASVKLVLTVDTITEETLAFDPFIDVLNDKELMLWLERDGAPVGVLALDAELSAAIVEMRTTGQVYAAAAPERRATSADVALARPLFAGLLKELDETTQNTSLDGWTSQVIASGRIASARAASLALPENNYRHMAMTLDLGVGGRKGMMRIALPASAAPAPAPALAPEKHNWAEDMHATVMEAPATLEAILHRAKMPLARLASLQVGQIIPLAGCQVSSVKLEAADGTFVARGRIGQMGGNIAVRIETPKASPMTDLDQDAQFPDTGLGLPGDQMAPMADAPMDLGFDAGGLGDDTLGDMPVGDLPMEDMPEMDTAFDPSGLPDLPMGDDATPEGGIDLPMDDFPAMDFDPDAFPDGGET